ncbi:MAG: selenium metabolism-associated LysR family transcriptional regulator [Syntrophobacteraceae bacterium]|jgi:DNA-binding transcriptional LysR family regulator|nr:selenium metabolism-associated LysR family transcriptional regulator [Syntrophobacteraceae bacterium]
MDIHRLEVFCRVVDLQSFTKAAEASFLTQPTVSEHIRALEEALDEKLVDRLGREVLPTPAGKILYRYARNIIALRDEAIQALDRHKGILSGHLLMGASTIPGTYILPGIIGAFKARYPSIQVTLKISGSAEVIEKIREGALEIGMVGARWSDRRVLLEEIFSDELVLTVHPDHPWAGRASIRLQELEGEPFILREKGSGTRLVMQRMLEAHGFDPARLNGVAEMGSTEAVRQGIKARIGVSIISYQAVAEDVQRGTLVTLATEGVTFRRPFYLVQRKNRQISPLGTAFLGFLKTVAGERCNLACIQTEEGEAP